MNSIRLFTIRTFTTSIKKLKENNKVIEDGDDKEKIIKELNKISSNLQKLNENTKKISESIDYTTLFLACGFFGLTMKSF